MLDLHTGAHGYVEVSPPYIISRDCMVGVGQFPSSLTKRMLFKKARMPAL